jgi:outer membrane immunogenic protein
MRADAQFYIAIRVSRLFLGREGDVAASGRSASQQEHFRVFQVWRVLMRTTATLAAAFLILAGSASAQEAPGEPFAAYASSAAFTWSGAYVGVHAGSSTGRFGRLGAGGTRFSNWADLAVEEAESSASIIAGVTPVVNTSVARSRRNGAGFGTHFGYNFHQGNFVWGVEGDVSFVNSRVGARSSVNARTVGFADNTATANDTIEMKWVATARGRLGFAHDRFLGYVTGGLAFGQVQFRRQETLSLDYVGGKSTASRTVSASRTQVGFAAGAGAEYALTDNVSLRGEYLYVDLGKARLPGQTNKVGSALHQARIGVNYRF